VHVAHASVDRLPGSCLVGIARWAVGSLRSAVSNSDLLFCFGDLIPWPAKLLESKMLRRVLRPPVTHSRVFSAKFQSRLLLSWLREKGVNAQTDSETLREPYTPHPDWLKSTKSACLFWYGCGSAMRGEILDKDQRALWYILACRGNGCDGQSGIGM
jgi:hypothetical protein